MRRVLLGLVLAIAVAGCQAAVPVSSLGPSPALSGAPTASTPPSPSELPTPVPTATVPVTPTPAATPNPTQAGTPICLAAQLKATVTEWGGAAGSQVATVTLSSASGTACIVQGTPEVELVDANGAILIDSQTAGPEGLPHVAPGDPAFVLAFGDVLATNVRVANYCGPDPALPTTVAFVLPASAGRVVAAPGPGGAAPGCMSDPGSLGSAEMNGWTK